MPLHRFGGFMVNVCAAPGDMKKREPDSSEEEVYIDLDLELTCQYVRLCLAFKV